MFSTAGNVSLPAGPGGATVFIREADVVQYTPSVPNDYTTGICNCSSTPAMRTCSILRKTSTASPSTARRSNSRPRPGISLTAKRLSGDREDVLTYQVTSLGENTTGSYVGITFDGSVIFGRLPGATIDLNALDYFDFPQTTNHPPTAQNLTAEVAEDGSVQIQLLGDDGEPGIDQPLTYVIVRGPAHGFITSFDPATGLLTYYPGHNYNGTDQITYLVQETDESGMMTISELAVVEITVTPVNDPPTVRFRSSQFSGDQNVPLLIPGSPSAMWKPTRTRRR